MAYWPEAPTWANRRTRITGSHLPRQALKYANRGLDDIQQPSQLVAGRRQGLPHAVRQLLFR